MWGSAAARWRKKRRDAWWRAVRPRCGCQRKARLWQRRRRPATRCKRKSAAGAWDARARKKTAPLPRGSRGGGQGGGVAATGCKCVAMCRTRRHAARRHGTPSPCTLSPSPCAERTAGARGKFLCLLLISIDDAGSAAIYACCGMCALMKSLICERVSAPTLVAASCPPLNIISVGMPRIPILAAMARLSSTLTFTTCTWPSYS